MSFAAHHMVGCNFYDNGKHEGIIALCDAYLRSIQFLEIIDILYHEFNGSLSSDKEQKLNTFSVSFASWLQMDVDNGMKII